MKASEGPLKRDTPKNFFKRLEIVPHQDTPIPTEPPFIKILGKPKKVRNVRRMKNVTCKVVEQGYFFWNTCVSNLNGEIFLKLPHAQTSCIYLSKMLTAVVSMLIFRISRVQTFIFTWQSLAKKPV